MRGTLIALSLRAGARFGVPRHSFAGLARSIVERAGWGVASTVLAQRELTGAVRDALGMDEAAALARQLGATVRELLRAGVDVRALQADEAPRVREVAAVAAAYQARLRAQGLLDGAELVTVAAQHAERAGPVTVFGYLRLAPEEARLLDALAGEGSALHLPWGPDAAFAENEGTAAWFGACGWAVERDGRAPAPATVSARSCADPEEEVRVALADVQRHLRAGTPPEDVALVVADDHLYGPLVEAVAWEYGVPVAVTTARPLAHTRLGSWLERALAVVEDGPGFERVALLLGHPLDAGVDGPAWQRLRHARPQDAPGWAAEGVDLTALAWPDGDTRSAWVARVLGLLEARVVPARAGLDDAAWRALMKDLPVLAEPAGERTERAAFMSELRALLSLVVVAPEAEPGAVELLTPQALAGAWVPHVYGLGVAEGVWPAPLTDDPVLDFAERARLTRAGVPLMGVAGLARREQLAFWGVQRAAGNLTLSYPRRTPTGGEGLPSAHLARLGLDAPPVGRRPAGSVEEARQVQLRTRAPGDAALSHARAAHAIEVRREGSPTFDAYDGVTGVPVPPGSRRFSASQLRTLGTCAFRWWLSSLLGLEVEADEEDAVGLGRLQHAALLHLARAAGDAEGEDARARMLAALDAALTAAEADTAWPQTPEWRAERPDVRARLERLVRAPAFLHDRARILAGEADFEGTWRGFAVRGQVDRVDLLNDKVIVVDYKGGRSKPWGAQDDTGRLTLDLQLPIYLQAALPALYPERAPGGAQYLSIQGGEVIARVSVSETALDAFAARARASLEGGAFPPQPDVAARACTRCPFPATCRGGPRLARKARA